MGQKKCCGSLRFDEAAAAALARLGGGALRARAAGECVLCLDKAPDTALTPCSHLCVCAACAAGLALCPLCKARVDGRVRVIFSCAGADRE